MNEKFLKPYNPNEVEERIYKLWQESGFFDPDKLPKRHKAPFTIVLPPPNVTGVLHMGHALMATLQDIFIRYKRIQGYKALWLPGTDHAAIATQSRVEKEIQKKEGKSRYDLGREELLKRIEAYAKESHDTIVSQIKLLGASLDWSREAFTLDEKRNLAVKTVFKKMYDDGLIYQGNRIVNWDPKGQTTISDDEIVYEERSAKLYTFKYSADFPIAISTTRPETKVGDTAVAVHPDDTRYQKYIGQTFEVNFCNVPLKIKIIADKEVDPEFGTGALGVTPAHSIIDWEMADRHDLPRPQVIDEKARMILDNVELKGKKVLEAREIIVEWLKKENLLQKEEDTKQNVGTAERTGGIVEPLPKKQWFVAVNKPFKIENSKIKGIKSGDSITLKELMIQTVKSGQIEFMPEHMTKTYFNWIENLRDWCISRQIWYGHRIPVWYQNKNSANEKIHCGLEAPKNGEWMQDEDTLDTWFSSGLWTFSTLGWPDKTKDLETFHPTSVLETGYDIIFFWVARMILMTGYALNDIPFEKVYFNGIVRDKEGRKLSKSLGNALDPRDLIAKYGADAVRMALIVGTGPGTDSKISEEKIRGYKHFANKLWNITRFVLQSTEFCKYDPKFDKWNKKDQELKAEYKKEIIAYKKEMDEYKVHIAGERIYQYVWHIFADKIIEESKPIISGANEEDKNSRAQFLLHSLREILIALHPFTPFVTEEIWQNSPWNNEGLLMIAESRMSE